MKRFYKLVSISHLPQGFAILLDGKNVKTPLGKLLCVDDKKLAELIMLEWSQQDSEVKPHLMPLTQMVTTCLDRAREERETVSKSLLEYLDTDLLCYEAQDYTYRDRQIESWGPVRLWFEQEFDCKLLTTTEIKALKQDKNTHDRVGLFIQKLNDLDFTAFQILVEETGSLILAIAFLKGSVTAQRVFNAAFIEDLIKGKIYDEEKYGASPDQERKRDLVLNNLKAIEDFLKPVL